MWVDRMSLSGIARRLFGFAFLIVASAVAFHSELAALANLSFNDDRYTYVAVVPFVVIGLLLLKRRALLDASRYCVSVGLPLLVAGVVIAGTAQTQNLSAAIAGIVTVWVAAFVLLFGPEALWIARFPLILLFLAIPIPASAMDRVTTFLQNSSAYMSAILFRAIRVPILQQGLIFSLPGFDIQIAPQCSGIRSTVSLVIASGLAGYIFLRTAMHRLLLVLVTVPLVIFKNAVRIVTLSSLALYVNPGFLRGNLHHYGGLCFSVLDPAVVVPLLLYLHKSEARAPIVSDGALVKCS
jgi:exosortase